MPRHAPCAAPEPPHSSSPANMSPGTQQPGQQASREWPSQPRVPCHRTWPGQPVFGNGWIASQQQVGGSSFAAGAARSPSGLHDVYSAAGAGQMPQALLQQQSEHFAPPQAHAAKAMRGALLRTPTALPFADFPAYRQLHLSQPQQHLQMHGMCIVSAAACALSQALP